MGKFPLQWESREKGCGHGAYWGRRKKSVRAAMCIRKVLSNDEEWSMRPTYLTVGFRDIQILERHNSNFYLGD